MWKSSCFSREVMFSARQPSYRAPQAWSLVKNRRTPTCSRAKSMATDSRVSLSLTRRSTPRYRGGSPHTLRGPKKRLEIEPREESFFCGALHGGDSPHTLRMPSKRPEMHSQASAAHHTGQSTHHIPYEGQRKGQRCIRRHCFCAILCDFVCFCVMFFD